MSKPEGYPPTEGAEDPYQNTFGPYHNEDWFRHQNMGVLSNPWCIICGASAAEEHPHRAIAAGGCLEGPFCSRVCHWLWLCNTDWLEETDRAERRAVIREGIA